MNPLLTRIFGPRIMLSPKITPYCYYYAHKKLVILGVLQSKANVIRESLGMGHGRRWTGPFIRCGKAMSAQSCSGTGFFAPDSYPGADLDILYSWLGGVKPGVWKARTFELNKVMCSVSSRKPAIVRMIGLYFQVCDENIVLHIERHPKFLTLIIVGIKWDDDNTELSPDHDELLSCSVAWATGQALAGLIPMFL